ncbi:MAG TPA: hypothetical protein VFD58_18575 [Blastocatellia bacterium]|nr:hypothetical protein [Blastocatellia bacterium]
MKPATQISRLPAAESSLATRLLRAVLAKSFLEILVVSALVALAAYWHFNPQLRGAIDVADEHRVAGWVADPRKPGEAIEVQLFIDGQFVAVRHADESRGDLVRAGAANDRLHGFTFTLESVRPAAGRHTVQVYALRPSSDSSRILLPLSEQPLMIEVR